MSSTPPPSSNTVSLSGNSSVPTITPQTDHALNLNLPFAPPANVPFSVQFGGDPATTLPFSALPAARASELQLLQLLPAPAATSGLYGHLAASSSSNLPNSDNNTVIVHYIPWDTSPQDVWKFFATFGGVTHIECEWWYNYFVGNAKISFQTTDGADHAAFFCSHPKNVRGWDNYS